MLWTVCRAPLLLVATAGVIGVCAFGGAAGVRPIQEPSSLPPDAAVTLFSPSPPPHKRVAESVGRLNEWLRWYLQLGASKQQSMIPAAAALARQRRPLMLTLIQRDPERALALALTPDERSALPDAIADHVERYIDARGTYRVEITCYVGDPKQSGLGGTELRRYVEINDGVFDAYVFGRRQAQPTKIGLPIHGIAIDDQLALDDEPFRLLDRAEALARGFQKDQRVVLSGETTFIDGIPYDVPTLHDKLVLQEQWLTPIVGRVDSPPPLTLWTTGLKRVLIIRVDYDDAPGMPVQWIDGRAIDEASIHREMAAASAFFVENSERLTTLDWTILPEVLRLPETLAAYTNRTARQGIISEGPEAARRYDAAHGGTGRYDPANYERVVIVSTAGAESAVGGGTNYGARDVVLNGVFNRGILTHELGHTYMFLHASLWLPDWREVGRHPLGPGVHVEYGDPVDRMGMGGPTNHYNAFFKQHARWLGRDMWTDVRRTGIYRVYAHDLPGFGIRALRVVAGPARIYWIDVRRSVAGYPSLLTGAEVRYEIPSPRPDLADYWGLRLLDMTPETFTADDHPLAPETSFEDRDNRVRFTNRGSGVDAIGQYVDMLIEFGI